MPRPQSLLIAVGLSSLALGQERLLFTGDILLSRQVRREIEQTGRFPWTDFQDLFKKATWVAGNLEGAVGKADDCLSTSTGSPCFDIPPDLIKTLSKAGFRALGVANNHAADLGDTGRSATRVSLSGVGLDALSYDDSPVFVRLATHTMAVVALSTVPGRDGKRDALPSIALRQKLRLARNLADLVVVFIHWGSELLEWPDVQQREGAGWLIRNGADLIVGHHPHVVQAPECVGGKPVFFSLGNHLFDQKYPATKEGLIADCTIGNNILQCGGIRTHTPPSSAIPQIAPTVSAVKACPVTLAPTVTVNGYSLRARVTRDEDGQGRYVLEGTRTGQRTWRSPALPLVSAEAGKMAGPQGPDHLLTLEPHHSPIDNEDGLRPYVYEVHAGGLVAKWRGSALAWPLLDATLLPDNSGVLCALHRGDSFLVLEPGSRGVRTAAYRWNGFGFSGIDDPATLARCRSLLVDK